MIDDVCASDFHPTVGGHGSALQAAVCRGDQQVVNILLAKGSDVNVKGGEYGNALRAASCWGYQGIIEMLLGHETSIDAEKLNIVLWDACYNGDEKIVGLVLVTWANGDKDSEDHDTFLRNLLQKWPFWAPPEVVLQWSIANRHERVLQILAEVQMEKKASDPHGLEDSDPTPETDHISILKRRLRHISAEVQVEKENLNRLGLEDSDIMSETAFASAPERRLR